MNYTEALEAAKRIDPEADHAWYEPSCLLIANEYADEVLALFPDAWRDDNNPLTEWTRIVLPAEWERQP